MAATKFKSRVHNLLTECLPKMPRVRACKSNSTPLEIFSQRQPSHFIGAESNEWAFVETFISHIFSSVLVASFSACLFFLTPSAALAQSAPAISNVAPNSGMTDGFTSVTITGTNFTGVTGVKFGATPALFFTFDSATSITAISPPGSVGVVDVTVTTPVGTSAFTSADQFTYLVRPTLTSISPSTGPSSGGTSVTISGTNLDGATAVSFGISAAASFVVNSATSITAVSPPGSSGTVHITVTTHGGTTALSSADQFTYVPAPTVDSVTPNSGPATGGTSVTIAGTNFTSVSSVSFGATAAASFTVNGTTSITALSPPNGGGIVDIAVTTPGGASPTSSSDQFTYVAAPTVASISPNSGPASGGTSVTISGTNFTGTSSVSFGATPATSFTLNSPTSITAVSPPGGVGTVDIIVATPGGASATSSASRFAFIAGPAISSISPNAGPLSGGTMVTITGTNLTSATAVNFGGTAAASFTVSSATSITAVSPPNSAGVIDITVTTSGGTSPTSSQDRFIYAAGPAVTAVSPNGGPTAGGTSITITGVNLSGVTAVKFGSIAAASYTVGSTTSITAVAPPGTGVVDVTVTTPGGISAQSPSDIFTYVAGPTVTSISPSGGPVAGGTSVTITGTNFTGLNAVKFGSRAATSFTLNSTTSITAVSPANNAGQVDIIVTTAQGGVSTAGPADRFLYGEPDSQKARAIQNLITPMVAQISGQAITGAIDGAIDDAFSSGGQAFVLGPNGASFNFAAEPRTGRDRIDDAFAALGSVSRKPAIPQLEREWSLWLDIRGTGWKVNDNVRTTASDLTGNQLNVTAGVGRKLSPDTLVGVFVGYENFKYDVASLGGGLKGNGETVGGYFARRFGDLRFDAKVGWSNVDYDITAGTAKGAIGASRWLASAGLTRDYKFGQLHFEPSAKAFMLWEQQRAWTDSLGTAQGARDFSVGRASTGAKLSQAFELPSGWKMVPFVGAYSDYRFGSDSSLPSTQPVAAISQGWSARVTSGTTFNGAKDVSVSLGGELGGIGSNYRIWTGQARANIPF
ncbi:MAG: IPT/TIG domain-containing protein [Afipia sp.]|nr:IPT/TIG domain-containing protein [Afipia sp.]